MENKELCVHNRNSRVLWIDNARGILFFIVMIYHTFIDPDMYRSVYAPIFLTGFFFISGVLYKKKESIYKNLESITNNILIPFFIFSIVLSAYESVRIDSSFAESFKEIFIKGGDVIWFLPCLVVVEGIYILLDRIMQRKFLAIVIIFISGTTFLYSINNSPDHLFWNIDTAMYAILYFWMGNLYSQHAPINTDNTLTKRLRFNCLTTLTSRKILLLGGGG